MLDRVTKAVVWRWFPELIVGNPHGALGLLPEQLTALGLGGVAAWLGISRQWSVGLALILAGGVSNLIDRAVWGKVIDFVRLTNFSVFNLADILLTSGVLLVIVQKLLLVRKADETGNSL